MHSGLMRPGLECLAFFFGPGNVMCFWTDVVHAISCFGKIRRLQSNKKKIDCPSNAHYRGNSYNFSVVISFAGTRSPDGRGAESYHLFALVYGDHCIVQEIAAVPLVPGNVAMCQCAVLLDRCGPGDIMFGQDSQDSQDPESGSQQNGKLVGWLNLRLIN